ncbi:GNAT family N-acetyltransferase [Salimicrobium jeotgali]|uniref:GNAT family N-acetyltransferase n=1 Tax=Salimicrobium jeotgali TaxID=1230341 RepID=K2G5R9_9BACI|nr:GNAT family N-acetyltransferase [Salimicrobium jeotgali]AKG04823.1 GNAT family N-acetyltransferase [Salimicrobium jeotgali]EKE30568.1 N-acetyltransferase GCN5 [Salimicrobium jeotgali]MBM7696799.1 L-amino acid N-acyltransferase YncA [Salimicrobium jeotgali]
MEIRSARLEDAPGVAKVQVETWKTTYRGIVPEGYLNRMTPENRREKWEKIIEKGMVYVAVNEEEEITGFASGGPSRSPQLHPHEAELYAIYIREDDQGKGLGRKLLTPVVNELMEGGRSSMLVYVLAENESRYFYEALGAKLLDKIKIGIDGKTLNELIYGWDDISGLATPPE